MPLRLTATTHPHGAEKIQEEDCRHVERWASPGVDVGTQLGSEPVYWVGPSAWRTHRSHDKPAGAVFRSYPSRAQARLETPARGRMHPHAPFPARVIGPASR